VIYETSRLATIVNGVLRKTTRDLEINGTYNISIFIKIPLSGLL